MLMPSLQADISPSSTNLHILSLSKSAMSIPVPSKQVLRHLASLCDVSRPSIRTTRAYSICSSYKTLQTMPQSNVKPTRQQPSHNRTPARLLTTTSTHRNTTTTNPPAPSPSPSPLYATNSSPSNPPTTQTNTLPNPPTAKPSLSAP
jgi:hypothetical protein